MRACILRPYLLLQTKNQHVPCLYYVATKCKLIFVICKTAYKQVLVMALKQTTVAVLTSNNHAVL